MCREWERFFASPELYVSYVQDKKEQRVSSKYPDFKLIQDRQVCLGFDVFTQPNSTFTCFEAIPILFFRAGSGLWIKSTFPEKRTPMWVEAELAKLPPMATELSLSSEIWDDLFAHPDEWVDCRNSKTGLQPHFKSKDNSKALWIGSKFGDPVDLEERLLTVCGHFVFNMHLCNLALF